MARIHVWLITVFLLGASGTLCPVDAFAQPRMRPPRADVIQRRIHEIQADKFNYHLLNRRSLAMGGVGACAAITMAILHRLNSGNALSPRHRHVLTVANNSRWVQGREARLQRAEEAISQVQAAVDAGEAPIGSNGYFDMGGFSRFDRFLTDGHRVPFVVAEEGVLVFEADRRGWETLEAFRAKMSEHRSRRLGNWVVGAEWVNGPRTNQEPTR